MKCPEGKKCSSKCGDTIHFLLADPGSNKCKHFELSALVEEGRKCYKLDQYQRVCNNNHVVEGVEERKKANPCNECKETIEEKLNAYLSFRPSSISLDAGNDTAKLFCKSRQPASIPFLTSSFAVRH